MAIDFDRVIVTVDDNVADLSAGQSILLASGVPGQAATVAVGTVTTLPAGSPATVENVGDENDAVFDFGIPKGEDGDNAPAWGNITGTLSDQEDLKAALDDKADADDVTAALALKADAADLGGMAYEDDAEEDDAQYIRSNGAWEDLAPTLAKKADVIESAASGSLVTVTDGSAVPVVDLTVAIDPVQDLNGYDAPWPAGGGVNLLNPNIYSMIDKQGIKTTVKSDNVITFTGTSETSSVLYFILNTVQSVANKEYYSLVLPAGTYTFSVRKANGSKVELGGSMVMYYWYEADTDADRKQVAATTQSYTSVTATFTETAYVIPSVAITNGKVTNFDVYFQLESGSVATTWSPYENACPISGWTGVKVTRTGKNLLPNLKYKVSNSSIALGQNKSVNVKTIYLKPGTYTLSVSTNNVSVGLFYRKSATDNTNYSMKASQNVGNFTVTEADYFSFWAYKGDVLSIDDVLSFQLELGSTASAYEPYQGQTISVSFPTEAGTVYGGSLDVTSGVLTVDRYGVDLGTLSWAKHPSVANAFKVALSLASVDGYLLRSICSKYKLYNSSTVGQQTYGIAISNPGTGIYIKDIDYSDVTTLTQSLDGETLVYTLAIPLTYQLTPQQMTTLLGENNIWADTGDVSVTYRADTKLYIDGKIAASQQATRALIAGIETTATATKNYSIGDLLIVGDALYKVTAVITSGETITEGTNVTATTVAEQLLLLASA